MSNELLDNKNIANTFGGAAGKPFNEDIVDYRKADPETKAKMDKLIASIDLKDLNTITVFGKEPTDVLRESSEAIVKRAQNATTFLGGFAQIKEKLENFDFNTVGKLAADYSAKVERKLKMAALSFKKSPFMYVVKKVGYFFTGIGGGKETSMDNIRHEIDKSLLQLADVVADLEESKAKIPGVIKDLNTLEDARLNAYSDYGIYVGAALEKYRQVKEDVLPKLEEEASTSPLKQVELRNIRLAATVLNAKVTDMDTFHKSSLVQLKTIDDLQEALAMSQLKIDSHLTISQGQWTAILAEAATAAQVSEIAETVKTADDFGDKIFEQSQKLSDMTKAMSRAAFGHGTLDPVKVIQHLEKRTQDIKDDLVFMTEFNAKMEAQRTALDEAGQKFREAASKVTAPRAVQEAAEQAATAAMKQPQQPKP